ncbi:MAG: helix-turn-helix domain-containing protein [Desulfovibrionaceae bacterium]|nr:helix-turn-helix domain-containing protein [Desulfovibrionaceae bacterium]
MVKFVSHPEFKKRIRTVIETLKISDKEFAEQGGITRQTLSGYLNTDREPSRSTLAKWIRAYGINANWLLLGEGPMFRTESKPDQPTDPLAQRVETVVRALREANADDATVQRAILAIVTSEEPRRLMEKAEDYGKRKP